MILLKWEYSKIWPFLKVEISIINLFKIWNTGNLTYFVIGQLGQVAKLERTWNLAPLLQIVQKITENYRPFLYLLTSQVWWLLELWLKIYIQKCTLSHVLNTNTQRDVTDLVNHRMVKNTKTWISWEGNIIFLWNKKILNLCFRWHILRSYSFVVEVTYKPLTDFNWNFLMTVTHKFSFLGNDYSRKDS